MNSFYSTLYGKFSDMQVDQSFSARLVYPGAGPLPSLKTGKEISDCKVRVPTIKAADGVISYGPFMFEDTEFGQAASVKLAVATTCLLSAKSVFGWLYHDYLQEWLVQKADPLRAGYAANIVLDALARRRIREVQGDDFDSDVMQAADRLSAALLPRSAKDLGELGQAAIASHLLGKPIRAPAPVSKIAQDFASKLDSISVDPSRLVDMLRDRLLGDGPAVISSAEAGWDRLARTIDALYAVVDKVPGRWHGVYLPYSHPLAAGRLDSVFAGRMITEKESGPNGGDMMWQEVFFELQREENRNGKALERLARAARNQNFGSLGFPASDYASYHKLHSELAPQIRRIVEQARMVKNVMDENTFEESGSIDLQVAIQAVASETPRNDIFVKDEKMLKNESWTILIDSSLSLGGSSREVKAVSICLAETAREIMGANPWGMFAFSDDLYCIKDFSEPYGHPAKARIGGMVQGGLSHIPDAIRACRSMIAEHAMERNYLILVSDGLPSGYPGIESEFAASVKELGRYGVDLAAIGIVGSGIKKTIRRARIVEKPADMVKEFMEIYYALSA
jgi:hypothetical protein